MKLAQFLKQAASVLNRLDALLPPEAAEPGLAGAGLPLAERGAARRVGKPAQSAYFSAESFSRQWTRGMQRLVRDAEQFLEGRPANNVLMSGARGTGKSSLVKALLHEYAARGLRLIEVDRTDLVSLPSLLSAAGKAAGKVYRVLR